MTAPRRLADIRRAVRDRIVAVPRTARMPIAEQQRHMWFLYQLAPDRPVYNEPFALRLRGPLDVAALQTALRVLVERHESLRSRFGADGGVPYQVIDAVPAVWPLPVYDVTEDRLQETLDAGAVAPFDLECGPVFRTSLLRLGSDDHVLTLTWHHIVSDGWSVRRISEELAALYGGQQLPPLAVQPADHATWQQRWLRGEAVADQVAYWRAALDGVEYLEFPIDRARPVQMTLAGAILQARLPDELSAAVRAFSSDSSLLAVLFAAFQLVLYRYTGQDDVVVGTLLSGRAHTELTPMVGFFANTIPIRSNLHGNPTFQELVQRCNDTLLDAMANQELPFGTLVEQLRPERLPGRNPLLQHLFTLLPAAMAPAFSFAGLDVETLYPMIGTSRFDFALQITDEPSGGLAVWLEYSTELYDRDRMQRLVAHLSAVLARAVAAPDTRIDDLDILPPEERRQVLSGWNPVPGTPTGRLLHELVASRVAQQPDYPAMRFAGADLTYAELDARSNALAHRLARRDVAGRVVAVLLERGFGLPVADLAVLKAGAAWLPIDPQYPPDRIAYQLDDAAAAAAVTTPDLADLLPDGIERFFITDDTCDTAPAADIAPEDAAYVIYTSGSTGTPKGVMVPHRAAVNFCTSFAELFRVTPTDRILQFSNPAFDVSVSDLFATLSAGATIVGAPRSVLLDPAALQQLVADERVSIMDIPPPVLGLLDPAPLRAVRVLFIGMEPFGAQLVNRWSRPGLEFHNGYGPTEATITCVDYRCPPEPLSGPPPIGRAMANQRAYVLDRWLRPAPIGVAGELFMAGAGLAHGYVGRPDLTADKFLPDPYAPTPGQRMYATGDVVRWRADGNIEFLGRADRQVKLRGLRVELGEVEHVLADQPGVRQATVVVRQAGTPQAHLVGYLVADGDQRPDPDKVRQRAGERLPTHMIPAALVVIDELPLTPTGKLDPARLPEPQITPGAALTTPTQQRLAQIWTELLGVEVAAGDNFFAVGGTSLQITQLISRVRDVFGVTLEPRQLFTHPALDRLADIIDAALPPADAEVEHLEADIAGLSEAELDRLLGLTN